MGEKRKHNFLWKMATFVLLITAVLCCNCFMTERNMVTAQAAVDKNGFDIRDGLLYWYKGTSKKVVIPDTVTVIGEGAFYNQDITSVTIPDTVTEIKPIAFEGCSNLTSITIPESVNSIGMRAFAGCSKLSKVTISGSALSIGEKAFLDCTALTSVTMLDGVLEIGEKAFDGCQNVTELTLADTITTIGAYAFQRLKMKELTLPGSVTTMGKVAFGGCSELTKLTVSEGATTIGAQAFVNCPKLTEVILPDSLITIEKRAFSRCESLCKIEIPKNVTTIGEYAFYSCSSAVSVTIPRSVTYIESGAFSRLSEDAVFYVAKGSYAESAIKRLYSYEYEYIKEEVELPVPEKPYKIANVVNGVHVYWTAIDGIEKYGLWRSENGKNGTYKWLANPTVAHFTDTKVESGKTYYYKVTAMDVESNTHGDMSESLGIVFVGTPDITSRSNVTGGIKLGWQKISGATGYAIYRKSYNGTGAWVRIATITGNSTFTYTDTSVSTANGTVYRYTIRALAGSDRKTLSGCRNTGRTMVRLTDRTVSNATAINATSVKCTWTTTAQANGYEIRFIPTTGSEKKYTIENYKTGVKTFTGMTSGATYTVQVRSYKTVEGVGTFYSGWSSGRKVTMP